MATESWLEVGRDGHRRRYSVWYADDPPERQEAVTFFGEPHHLFPAMELPREVYGMPLPAANHYLRDHPIPKLWTSLTVRDPIRDDDLARLQFLPELKMLKLHCNVSDAAVRHVLQLKAPELLLVYSSRVTDQCLETISKLSTLRYLDMQRAGNVSPTLFNAVVHGLPRMLESWPPRPAA